MMNGVRLFARKIFTAIGMLCNAISRKIYRTPQEKEVERWFLDNGDSTLRVNYDLTPSSVVLDIGGYEGDWAAEVVARYGCSVLVFEPVPEYARRIATRFQKNPLVKVFPFGLGSVDAKQSIHIAEEGSSLFASPNVPKTNNSIPIQIKKIEDFLKSESISKIDLLKINIEGGEYELLNHLIDAGIAPEIRNIQVQFHNFVPQAESRMREIQRKLARTHDLTYQYEFVWENWALRSI